MSNSKPYDVVLIPEAKIREKALEVSKSLENLGTYFTLDGENFFPHISLYMFQLKDIDLPKVFSLLDDIAKNTRIITVKSKLFGMHNNYIDVEYEKTPEIQQLQDEVIGRLNFVRDGLRERDKERLLTSSEEEKEIILKYGYRSVGEYFEPHMTFTRFKEPQNEAVKLLPDKSIFNGIFFAIGIYEMGDNGTCIREINRWKLH